MSRLIDADAITYELWTTEVDSNRDNYRYFQNRYMVDRRDIEAMPTIEERPKGNWIAERSCNGIKKGDVLKIDENGFGAFDASCSVCGKWLVASDEYVCYANFCPYCGADMRGNDD